jgi:uncharacterized RDD family membrane protein YckC
MRNFSARETEWLLELDGIELAGFWQRAFAITIDGIILTIIFSAIATSIFVGVVFYRVHGLHEASSMDVYLTQVAPKIDHNQGKLALAPNGESFRLINDIVVPILYFGILLWKGKGRTPGMRIMRIRVVSLMHRHITFWHAVERALGYGAAALEGGFGFVQFFIHPYRRCAQDRLAETIVVTERSYQALQHKLQHPLLPDNAVNDALPE